MEYTINVDGEEMTVTDINGSVLDVTRGVPVDHAAGDTVTTPRELDEEGNPITVPAVLEGVGFQIYRYTGMQKLDVFSSGDVTVHSWELAGTQFTDVHGEFWFTGLTPGIYTIRENLELRDPVLQIDYSGFSQSTHQAQGSPIAEFDPLNVPPGAFPLPLGTFLGANPLAESSGAIANLNVYNTGAGTGSVRGYVDTDPSPGVIPSSAMTINQVNSPGYNDSDRSFGDYNPPSYDGFIGGEYQWSNGTGEEPYFGPAFQRPMDTNDTGIIEDSEKLEAIVGTALKQAGTLDGTANSGGYHSLIWGNYVPVKIIGQKYEDLDGDGVYDDGSDEDHFVFDDPATLPSAVDIPMENVKFELYRVLRDANNAISSVIPVTTQMLAGGTNVNPSGAGSGAPVMAFTDLNGMYMFSDVVPGEYVAREAKTQDINPLEDAAIPGIMPSMLPIDDILVQGFVRDTYGDDSIDDMLDGETITVISVLPTVADPVNTFDYSDLVDDDNDPTTPPVPTHVWLNYIEGSIHGVKYEDINGDGLFNDVRIAETTTLSAGVTDTATTIRVSDPSIFGNSNPFVPYPIDVDGERMTVTGITGNVPARHPNGTGRSRGGRSGLDARADQPGRRRLPTVPI